ADKHRLEGMALSRDLTDTSARRARSNAGQKRPRASTGELVSAALDGDRRAWCQLVGAHSGLVWSIVRDMGLQDADAADVFQTVFLRMAERLHQLQDPDRLPGWLATTCRREVYELTRSKHRRAEPAEDMADQPASTAGPDELAEHDDTSQRVLAALTRMGEPCQSLLRMVAMSDDLSYAEIANALDIPVGSVGPNRARCLKKLSLMPEIVHLSRNDLS
ncbi:MAG: RNA polymerase sigma factor, partial [Acidimicrobiales bacterium]